MEWLAPDREDNCSGLLGRTPLRRDQGRQARIRPGGLFRSSRPDSIETGPRPGVVPWGAADCSGLLGRTPLRRGASLSKIPTVRPYCSGLLGRTPLRHQHVARPVNPPGGLFRSSRPDSIETSRPCRLRRLAACRLFRSSRPDSIETHALRVRAPSCLALFRSSRPDSIETSASSSQSMLASRRIVPVF